MVGESRPALAKPTNPTNPALHPEEVPMSHPQAAARAAIKEVVDRETRAWDTQDVELLLSVFHPDMVWPWPPHAQAHDPMDWVLEWGRYDRDRWRERWLELFRTHDLIHNVRELRKTVVSREGDGGFAVVDIDTLWRTPGGDDFRWMGRTCKIYTTIADGWKMIAQTGVLEYPAA